MDSSRCLAILVVVVFLIIARTYVAAIAYNANKYETMQKKKDTVFMSASNISIDRKPRFGYNKQMYIQPTLVVSLQDLSAEREAQINTEITDPSVEYRTEKTEFLDHQILYHNSNMSVQNYSSNPNQTTNNKLDKIMEKSGTLIKRLCAVHTSERKSCYQRDSSTCYCTGGLADCSGKQFIPNIAYAPKLPPNIKCLKFAYNNVQYLSESYFANVSTFVFVDFSFNYLVTISAKTFGRFTNLQYLILSYNTIGYKNLRFVLDYPPSLRLDIIGLGLKQIPEDYFYHYSNIRTSQIYMDFNYFTNLDLAEFANLDNLEYLSLTNCSIHTVKSSLMRKLKVLDLGHNNISIFLGTCNSSNISSSLKSSYQLFYTNSKYIDNQIIVNKNETSLSGGDLNQTKKGSDNNNKNVSLYPVLEYLYMNYNILHVLPSRYQICLPNIITLNLEANYITEILENSFTALKSLKVLILDKMNSGMTKIERLAFNISTLTSLYMSKNKIVFDSADISTQLFEGCSNLKVLSIDNNQLDGLSEDMFEAMLNNTPALKYIYLSSTKMRFIPVKAFSQLKNLEKLYIYVNDITEIPPGAFDEMFSLRYLYMDENQISTVQENAFSLKTRLRLKLINLSRNPYLCDCNLLWFQSWLNEAGSKQFMNFNDYFCSNINNISVQAYVTSKQACLFSREVYILFVVCLSIIIVLCLLFALVYRYRWNIRVMMYERRMPARIAESMANRHYRYDLFVIYCNDDFEWVRRLLIPVLETKLGLKVCIHQRDFLAGGSIFDNIVESMNDSKRILVVISSRFALSTWCNYELLLCQSHVITHDLPSLMVIILDKIKPRDMSAAMYALYNTTCFLEWPLEPTEVKTLFMKRTQRPVSEISSYPDAVSQNEIREKKRKEVKIFWERLQKSLANIIDKRSDATSVKRVG